MESREYERKPYFQKRKEIRKENRLNKNKSRHDSWIQHQKAKKLKKMETNLNRKVEGKEKQHKPVKEPKKFEGEIQGLVEGRVGKTLKKFVKEPSFGGKKEKKENLEKKSLKRKRKENLEKKSLKRKTKFEEYLDLEMNRDKDAAANDLRMERRLAKKLRMKKGKERSLEDEMNVLFDGTSYVLDVVEDGKDVDDDEEDRKSFSLTRKHKKRTLAVEEDNDEEVEEKDEDEEEDDEEGLSKDKDVEGSKSVSDAVTELAPVEPSANTPKISENVKYIAPHLRARMKSESEEHTKIRRSVRGLLNRLSESNVESITVEISSIFRSMVRSSGSQIISEEVLASCSGGPRGNEQYAAVFAAFVAGMASSVGIDFGAKLVASLAQCFEDEYTKEDNLSLRNLTLLLSYLCVFGVCSSDLIYDFLNILSKRLMEIDVSTILTILQCCGMKLRGDDPTAMKNFILSVQNRVNELKAPSGSMPDDQLKISNKRMEFMLETIFEIKNNKKKDKEDPAHFTRIKKWLQKLSSEDILLRGLTWAKLLDPNKKGLWWQTGDIAVRSENAEDVAITIDREVIEAQKLMQLATTQRMNTDARRSIFCIIMSGEDYVDAFEKLLRLDLPGKQDREIMRVLLECCLQEKVFNKYYCVLASRLCSHDKNHKFTLQYCIWDHYKALESMELIRSINLAKFTSEMFASFSLSLAVLKTVDLLDPKEMTPKRVMHFRMLFEALFENSDAVVWNMFSRIAILPELESLRNGLEFFIEQYVVSSNKSLGKKFKIAKKAFSNMEGLLM